MDSGILSPPGEGEHASTQHAIRQTWRRETPGLWRKRSRHQSNGRPARSPAKPGEIRARPAAQAKATLRQLCSAKKPMCDKLKRRVRPPPPDTSTARKSRQTPSVRGRLSRTDQRDWSHRAHIDIHIRRLQTPATDPGAHIAFFQRTLVQDPQSQNSRPRIDPIPIAW